MASNRETCERYAKALVDRDWRTISSLLHDDYIGEFPQTGEVIRGRANFEAVYSNYPTELPDGEVLQLAGEADPEVVVSTAMGFGVPMMTVMSGSDSFTVAGKNTYPDGSVFHVIAIVHLKEGKIHRESIYWAPPDEAPAWRSRWVELAAE